jgi:O-antigen biosynthesis protein WbqP
MKMCTPHDVPTHLLENPEQYITKIGKFIRKTSIDELPQIYQVFTGERGIIETTKKNIGFSRVVAVNSIS